MEAKSLEKFKKEIQEKLSSEEEISLKLLFLIKITTYDNLSIIKKDPLMKLLKNFKEIDYLLKLNLSEVIKYIYFSREEVHKILYDEEKLISIEFNTKEKNYETKIKLSYNFYLNLLINEKYTITNYSYSIDLIIKLNDIQKEEKDKDKYRAIFYSKCILDLINNYKQLDEYDDENEETLNNMEDDNKKYIEENINIFKDINANLSEKEELFISTKIDLIFSEIINSLIIRRKFSDYEYTYNIINQLELENIDITQTMYEKLFIILDKDKDYMRNYIMTKKEDLLEEKNINFYYILLKYILKNSIYIYQIPFLLDTRKLILKIIKTSGLLYENLRNDNNKNRLKYIFSTLADSEYYFEDKNINKLKEILKYYKNFYFETKKEDIKIIEDIIKNNKKDYEKHLNEYNIAKKMNIRLPIIKYIINSKEAEGIKNKVQIEEIIDFWNTLEILIKSKKYKKIRKDDKRIIMNYINDNKNLNILLKIFNKEQINSFINRIKEENNKSFSFLESKSTEYESSISLIQKESFDAPKIIFYLSKKEKEKEEKEKDFINIVYENINDPITKLFSNFNQIENILKLNYPSIVKFLYFNRSNLHKILLKEEKIININIKFDKKKLNLNIFFFLDLLINDKKNIVNYSYSLDLIRSINYKSETQTQIYKLILAKITIDLINNYRQLDIHEEKEKEESEELNRIIKDNKALIEENKSILKDLNINENIINEKQIDEIYSEIIVALIKFNNLQDVSLLEQLDLENINLTQKMFDNLIIFLNENKQLINQFKINSFQDFKNNKINFYFNLMKYILKDSIYIYQIPFLLETRKNIITIIQKELSDTSSISNTSILFRAIEANKMTEIVEKMTDLKYYYKNYNIYYDKITKSNTLNIREEDSYDAKNVSEEDLKNSHLINIDNEDDFEENKEDIEEVLEKSVISLRVEPNEKELKCTYYKIEFITGGGMSYDKFIKPLQKKDIETTSNEKKQTRLFLNYKKFVGFLEKIKEYIINNLKEKNINDLSLLIKLKIQKKDENIKLDFKNIWCQYILKKPNYCDINEEFIERNILNIEIYEKLEKLLNQIIEINYGTILPQENLNLPRFSNISSINFISNSNNTLSSRNINLTPVKYNQYKLLQFGEIIGNHIGSAYYIKELKKSGTFISGGTDNKIKIYSLFYNKQELEIKNNLGFFDYSEDKKVVIFSDEDIYIKDYYSNVSLTKNHIKDYKIINIVYFGSKTIFICTKDKILLLTDFLNSIIETKKTSIIDKKYIGGIKINDKIIAFVSNKLLLNGENQIIFYNINTRKVKIEQSLKGFSYTMSKNNLALMSIPKKYKQNENNILLLCGCKKYTKKGKNGILFVILEMSHKNINNIKREFYNTNNFEVYCFCPLFNINNKLFLNDKNEINQEETEYVLVGGLDLKKSQGLIKIYKVIEVNNKLKLEYIIDINIKENDSHIFKGFKGAITCITQTKDNGDILISCLDGNIYCFCGEAYINKIKNMELIKIN